jgi:hypothetical protein
MMAIMCFEFLGAPMAKFNTMNRVIVKTIKRIK